MLIFFHSLLNKELVKTDPANETGNVRMFEEIVTEPEMWNDCTFS